KAVVNVGQASEKAWKNTQTVVERQVQNVEELGRKYERASQAVRGFLETTKEDIEAVLKWTAAVGTAVASANKFEIAINRLRAARIALAGITEGLGGAAFVAGEVAFIVALEKAGKYTYEYVKQLERATVLQHELNRSARIPYNSERFNELTFAAGRAGKSPF